MAQSSSLYPIAVALLGQARWSGRAAVARTVGTHRANVQGWLDHLAHHRAIIERGDVRVDTDRLWHVLSTHRAVAQRPITGLATDQDPATIHQALAAANIPHAFGLFTAANQYAFFEPRQQHQLYIARKDAPQARAVLQADAGNDLLLFHEQIPTLPTRIHHGIPITQPVLTVADLRAHPEGGAHANFLQENLLPQVLA